MPYLKKERRESLASWDRPGTAGELNYVVTKAVIDYITKKLKSGESLSYQLCNDVVGALDNAKDEFRRRIQHPYEAGKMQTNGDVYDAIMAILDNPSHLNQISNQLSITDV